MRALRTTWGHASVYFDFGEPYEREPIGWKAPNGLIYDHYVPYAVMGNWHRGIDIPFSTGTPVQAALAGTCTYAAWSNLGYGNLVTVEGVRFKMRYAHLSRIDVEVGQHIKGVEIVGLSGASGNVTGPHLHVETYDKVLDAYVDPLHVLSGIVQS